MIRQWLAASIDGVPRWRFAVRVFWIALQLLLVYLAGNSDAVFFYQGF